MADNDKDRALQDGNDPERLQGTRTEDAGDVPGLDDKTAETGRIRQGPDRSAQRKTDRVNARRGGQLDVDELHRIEAQKRETSRREMEKLTSTDFQVGGDETGYGYAGVPTAHAHGQREERLERLR